jgi:hypothetical protein
VIKIILFAVLSLFLAVQAMPSPDPKRIASKVKKIMQCKETYRKKKNTSLWKNDFDDKAARMAGCGK